MKLYLQKCAETASENFGMEEVRNAVIDIITSVIREDKTYLGNTSIVDSGAQSIENSASYVLVNELKSKGLDMASLGATSWRYDGNQKMLYWTDQDISGLPVGTLVPVIRYNENSGTYTVWNGKITKATTEADKSKSYNTFGTQYTAYKNSTNQDSSLQTYENAVKWLKEAQLGN